MHFLHIAILVFAINCVVFVVRYQRKRMPQEGTQTVQQAHDWVWIGRETLERNAINTTCGQVLMPEADFNGNRQLAPGTGTMPSESSDRS